ncbi:MAG TPA: hypothetical protein VJY39_22455 [Acidisphaera sp.]|nr:hypothetical protein [Acidisphaera sp.]
MRNILLASIVALGALAAAPAADAQLRLNIQTTDPVTGLEPAQWEQLVDHMVNAEALVGDPGVLIISSMPVPLTITCDKWELVGHNLYSSVRGNPAEIKPFSITYIKTKDFDGYCKQGVVGHTSLGKTITGRLTSSDGSFTNATTILFSGTVSPQ